MNRKIVFKMISGACPEAYDAYIEGMKVGYLRLRWGHFTVRAPDHDGDVLYEAWPRGDGCFYDAEDRDVHLRFAGEALLKYLDEGPPKPRQPPDIVYELEDFYDPFEDMTPQALEENIQYLKDLIKSKETP